MRLFAGSILAALTALAAPAAAHAFLERASPAAGAAVDAPSAIRLEFSEPIEPALSSIELTSAGGDEVALADAGTDPKDARVFTARIVKPLTAGVYRVTWRVVSVDTHRTEGAYTFTVKP